MNWSNGPRPRKKGTILITLGSVLLAASLLITGYNLWDERRASGKVESVMETMARSVPTPRVNRTPEVTQAGELRVPDYLLAPEMDMPTVEVEGEGYIGYLSIPSLSLELPVMGEWSYPKLKQGPCRYTGSAYLDDLVICAHNYKGHFGGLKDLQVGDLVSFVDVDGNLFNYSVAELTQLEPTDVKEMVSSGWDLSLFTCTLGGRYRVTVRCQRIEEV